MNITRRTCKGKCAIKLAEHSCKSNLEKKIIKEYVSGLSLSRRSMASSVQVITDWLPSYSLIRDWLARRSLSCDWMTADKVILTTTVSSSEDGEDDIICTL